MFIDTHCHLPENIKELDDFVLEANNNGVKEIILSGADISSNKDIIKFYKNYSGCYIVLGYHPSEAGIITTRDIDTLEHQIKENHPIAVGEIGLDYYYGKEEKEKQILLMKKQLDLAVKYHLPVVLHIREAHQDAIEILKQYHLTGSVHCYSGSYEQAKEYIKMGYKLGIGGVVTFKNSKLLEIVKQLDLKDIILETDSPYLSPIRGTKNEPKNIALIANFIAQSLNIDIDDLAKITTSNAHQLFDL